MKQFDMIENQGPRTPEGHFAENELRLLDYLEGRLPTAEQAALDRHIAACPKCQALCAEWRELDFKLTASVKSPRLSSGFEARLWQAIDRETGLASVEARAEAKARLQAEMDARWAEFRKSFFRTHLPGLLDSLGYGAAAAVLAVLLYRAASLLVSSGPGTATAASVNQIAVPLAVATSLVFLAATALFAARTRVTRWLAAMY